MTQYKIYNESVILDNYISSQQSTEYTCGPTAVIDIYRYYTGRKPNSELEISRELNTSPRVGTTIKDITNWFRKRGFIVENSLEDQERVYSYKSFLRFVDKNLSMGYPIMVESHYLGGHWRVIVGYDKKNDMLRLADSYDRIDGNHDGYTISTTQEFYDNWHDKDCLPEEEKTRPWIIVKPPIINESNTIYYHKKRKIESNGSYEDALKANEKLTKDDKKFYNLDSKENSAIIWRYIHYIGNQPVGLIRLSLTPKIKNDKLLEELKDGIWIDMMVIPEFRGKDISKLLLNKANNWFDNQSEFNILLYSVDRDNKASLNFIKKQSNFKLYEPSKSYTRLTYYRNKDILDLNESSQPIFISEDDIEINLNEWKNGKLKCLFIAGMSGGGKSTLANILSKKYKSIKIEMDLILWFLKAGKDMPVELPYKLIEWHKYKTHKQYPDEEEIKKVSTDKVFKKNMICDYLEWVIQKTSKQFVIEGPIDDIINYRPKLLDNCALIVKGTSTTVSAIRRIKRDFTRTDRPMDGIGIRYILKVLFIDYPKYHKDMNVVRDYVDKTYNESIQLDSYGILSKDDIDDVLNEASRQPIIFSEDDVHRNVNKFLNKQCKVLWITGLSGGGKTTLANKICDQTDADLFSIDDMYWFIKWIIDGKEKRVKETIQKDKNYKIIYNFIIKHPEMLKANSIEKPKYNAEIVRQVLNIHSNSNQIVIEGVQVPNIYMVDSSLFDDKIAAIIIMGTSVLKSVKQRYDRDQHRDNFINKPSDIAYFMKKYYKWSNEQNKFRDNIEPNNESIQLDSYGILSQDDINNILNESTFISDDDLYSNFSKFDTGKVHYCFVTGFSGSGKTTLAKYLAKKYNAEFVELDMIMYMSVKRKMDKENLVMRGQNLVYKWIKETKQDFSKVYLCDPKDSKLHEFRLHKTIELIDWLIYKNKQKCIIEGVDLINIIPIKPTYDDAPFIFKGTSKLKSFIRRTNRAFNSTANSNTTIIDTLKKFFNLDFKKEFDLYDITGLGLDYSKKLITTKSNEIEYNEPIDFVEQHENNKEYKLCKTVYDSLSERDKKFVCPRGYKNVSEIVICRTIYMDNKEPMCFAECIKYNGTSDNVSFILLAVKDEYRGNGLGIKLLKESCEKCKAKGYKKMIYRVDRENTSSIRLIEKFKAYKSVYCRTEGKEYFSYQIIL